jgi:rod shape determining protein RodA
LTTFVPSAARTGVGPADRIRHVVGGLDWVLLGIVAAITAFSLYTIKAATRTDVAGNPSFFFSRQVGYVLLGVVGLVIIRAIPLERLARWHWAIWVALCASVALVLVLGQGTRGSTRWITLGPFNLQPSELGKVALVVVLAGLVVARTGQVGSPRFSLLAAGMTALPAAIVFLQPDLGTALVYLAILAAVLFLAGVPWTHFAIFGAVVALAVTAIVWALPTMGVDVLKPYQVDRLTAFVDSGRDVGDTGYQLEQSKTAVGSGGGLGKGPNGATQTINDFLPEHHTDFIFAVVAEMFGFAGAGGLILAYALLLWRGLRITARASNRLDQLVAGAIVAALAFQVFVNIGMTVGIMPITGIPLPFMSFGGSHTLANLLAIGLLLQIHQRRAPGIP